MDLSFVGIYVLVFISLCVYDKGFLVSKLRCQCFCVSFRVSDVTTDAQQ